MSRASRADGKQSQRLNSVHQESIEMAALPTERSIERIGKLVDSYTSKTGTTTHPNQEVTEGVVLGLAIHVDNHKRPLCPCRFYPDKTEELRHRTWICPCDDM